MSSALGSNLVFTQAGAIDSTPSQNGTKIVKQKPMTQDESRHKLTEWQNIVSAEMSNRGLGINVVGVNYNNQTLMIGLESLDKEKTDAVDNFLLSHQIPLDLVSLYQAKFCPLAAPSSCISTNSTKVTKLEYNGAVIVIHQTINKTELRDGQHITVHPEIRNIGNKSITTCYLWSPFFVEIHRQNGTIAYGSGPSIGAMEYHCLHIQKLKANGHFSQTTTSGGFGPIMLDTPGNYTVSSVTDYYFGDNTSNRTFVSSEPYQITVLPGKPVIISSLEDFPSPLKQQGANEVPIGVKCNPGLHLIFHHRGKTAACVKPDAMTKLLNRGWIKPITPITQFPLPIVVR